MATSAGAAEIALQLKTQRRIRRFRRPRVSIGICAYNEEKNIGFLLENLLNKQKLDQDSEIIVVCSGCTDRTPEVVSRFSDEDKRFRLIVEHKRRGKSSAINSVLDICRGEFLFLIPADVIPAPFALPRLLKEMMDNPSVGVVCGRPVPLNEEHKLIGYMGQLIWRLHHRTLRRLSNLNSSSHATGELMLMRKGIASHVPESVVNDDAYIAIEAIKKNLRVEYCPDAIVYIRAPSSMLDFMKQRRRVVYGHHRVKRLTKYTPRTLESMAFYDPSKTIGVLMEEIRERPKDSLKLFAAIYVEAIVNVLAVMDILTNRKHTVWAVAESTKELQ